MNSEKITNLALATQAADAMSMAAGDSRYYNALDELQSIALATDALDLNSHKIINLALPTDTTDMASKQYTDDLIATFDGTA